MAYSDEKPRVIEDADGIFELKLSGSVVKGDLIGLSSATWVAADANAGVPAYCVALQDGVSGEVIRAAHMAVLTSVTGATVGAPVYLSNTAGETTQSAPGDDQIVGYAISATSIFLHPTWVTPATV